ncbi:hypothetical protein K1719_026074 [Acacia pycnantha]|nr:hypothetical protein K1719_026074 [Acacia pycnantha]
MVIVSIESLTLEPSYLTFQPPHVASVMVSKDGGGNFTTINEALSAVLERASSSKVYFLIYVLVGVYEEYVSIDQGKTYMMMIRDAVDEEGFVAMNITFCNTAGPGKYQTMAV